MKCCFTVFCAFLLFAPIGFLSLSCGARAQSPAAADTSANGAAAASIPSKETAEKTGTAAGGGVLLSGAVLASSPEADFPADEIPDLILAAYRDPELREGVLAFFRSFTGPFDVAEVILRNADTARIPPSLAFALCAEESSFNPRAFNKNLNKTVDRGLFQLNSASFPQLKTDEFFDPAVNARYGLSHLRYCLDSAGTEVAGLAMYNAGASRVRAGGTPKKTLDYVSRILARQRRIETRFLSEYAGLILAESGESNMKALWRLSVLAPLGR